MTSLKILKMKIKRERMMKSMMKMIQMKKNYL